MTDKKKKVWWVAYGDFGKYREAHIAQMTVSEGGWYQGRSWLTKGGIEEAEDRWVKRCYETRADKTCPSTVPREYGDGETLQCGGCKFSAMVGGDFGICWNEKSPLDGCIIFEHGGCKQHSFLIELLAERKP